MTKDNWQRLKNLSLFKVWMTDRELVQFYPWIALLGFLVLLGSAAHRFLRHRGAGVFFLNSTATKKWNRLHPKASRTCASELLEVNRPRMARTCD